MFEITGFHHRIFIGRLLSWGNIFPAGELLHKETKIWSWQRYRECNRLATTKAPSQKTEQTSCRQKKKKLNVSTYTHCWSIQDKKKNKNGELPVGNFQSFWKWKLFFLWKKIKSKAPRGCFSARAADRSDSHPWKLLFYLQWLPCLSSLSFPEVS